MMSKSNLTTWEEVERYKEVALKTAAPLDGVIANLTHAALGLCDEAYELSIAQPGSVNEQEELGDCLWFAVLASHFIEKEIKVDPWRERPSQRVVSPRTNIMMKAMQIAGLIKKPFAYGDKKPIPWHEIADCVGVIISAIEDAANNNGATIGDIMRSNLAKLSFRFDGSFSSDRAINRDTQTENAVLDWVKDSKQYEICETADELSAAISRIVSSGYKADAKFFGATEVTPRCWVVKSVSVEEQ